VTTDALTPSRPAEGTLQLRIELLDVEPTVWRRILVPEDITMADLAEIILIAMGWNNSHRHLFRVGDEEYGLADEDASEDEINESQVTVSEVLGGQERFAFDYDFGDGWEHDVVIEKRSPSSVPFAECLHGENACPPDDVGGPRGYEDFLEALADATHEDHDEHRHRIGGSFDPSRFDLDAVNAELRLAEST
jgi:hypothetical protein